MLYFSAGPRGLLTIDDVRKLGLAYAFDSPALTSVWADTGPSGKGGLVFAGESAVDVRYAAERQQWERYPGKDGLWLGFWKEKRPGPSELQRRNIIPGHDVILGDGNKWVIPVARAIDGSSAFPRKLRWDGLGWIVGDVMPQYAELFAQACHVLEVMLKATETRFTLADEVGVAALALAVNYRVGPAEISLLELFNTESEFEVIKALVDWNFLLAEVKKKLNKGESEGQSSGHGAGV